MTIILDNASFYNDFYTVDLPDGSFLVFNKVDEALTVDGVSEDVIIKEINIEHVSTDDIRTSCPAVIGLENKFFKINSEYKEVLGLVLDTSNMSKCTIEVADE